MLKRIALYLLIPILLVVSAFTLSNNDKLYEIAKNMEIFTKVYQELNMNYVDDIDPNKLMRTGIDAMLASLDPYTNYISESQVTGYRLNSDSKYDGIGATTKLIGDYVTITEPFEGGPAFNAGLRAGDKIIAVNGESARNRSTSELARIVRGAPGTSLNLRVLKQKTGKEENITLLREVIDIPNVPYSGKVDDHIAYVSLSTFTANAGKNIAKSLKKMKREDPELEGVILDLRNNGGGLLREAISVSNIFVPKGIPLVSTKGKVVDRDKNYSTMAEAIDTEIPLVVLINKSSASASEIVSGSIQDLDRGVIMGQRSYGKGLVQNTMEVGYNSRVKLTTSKYYIPSGRCIQSIAYENGEPIDIPDHQRTVFYTRNKRPVLDGGGVTPDIKLEVKEKPTVVKALLDQNIIFNFVSDYTQNIDSIEAAGDYRFDDVSQFYTYVAKQDFQYKTKSEESLEDFINTAENERIDQKVKNQLDQIKSTIAQDKSTALKDNEALISDLIEEEIISRYYFQGGKVHQNLSDDSEVQEAIAVIQDQARYQSILSGR